MKKLLASIAIAAATTMTIGGVAHAGAPNRLPKTWTESAEAEALSLIEDQAAFDDYDSQCVLDQIQSEFSSPRNFVKHATSADVENDPRIIVIAVDVVENCEDASY